MNEIESDYNKVLIETKIVIVGAGFAGLAAAIRLKQEGEHDFIILERGSQVGGVWRDHHYPGCACDVESHLYSFSFAPNPKWRNKFGRQGEILTYLNEVTSAYDIKDQICFFHEVRRMDWIDSKSKWRIQTNQVEFQASFVIGAFGALSEPAIPSIKGIERFQGEKFHSAHWHKTYTSKGKRVAVIGTGASAIQFIPEIQPEAQQLIVFQRTAPWVVPRLDGPIRESTQALYQRFPFLQKLARLKVYLLREIRVMGFRHPRMMKKAEQIALEHLNTAVQEPELRKKLTPTYRMGCKRILLSNTYYPALANPNVQVNTNRIQEVTEDGVIDSSGQKVEVDTIIFGTGFQVTEMLFARSIYGRNGTSLSEEWKGSPKAYMGTTVVGFPNLFLLQGPNTGLGHTSVILMMEAQVEHLIKTIRYMKKKTLKTIEPSEKAQQRFIDETDESMKGTVWTAGGCSSWYLDQTGRNSTLWPGYTFSFRKKATQWNVGDYVET